MTASRFRDTRLGCGLTVEAAAQLLRVSLRTLQNWEAGKTRIPYAAYKLVRILRGYELPGPEWKGYRLIGDTLWSPEGMPFRAADHRWWSLTCRMAAEFRVLVQVRRELADGPRPVLKRLPDAPAASVGLADPDQSSRPLPQKPMLTGVNDQGTQVLDPARESADSRCLTLPNRPEFPASHSPRSSADHAPALVVGGAS